MTTEQARTGNTGNGAGNVAASLDRLLVTTVTTVTTYVPKRACAHVVARRWQRGNTDTAVELGVVTPFAEPGSPARVRAASRTNRFDTGASRPSEAEVPRPDDQAGQNQERPEGVVQPSAHGGASLPDRREAGLND